MTAIYRAALDAVDPGRLVRGRVARRGTRLVIALGGGRALSRPSDRVWVAGAGKASLAMARALAAV
ncbi:MAG: DUF4147 domain-containing protein, partial [Thermodesulfobacteriota bacterium]